MDKKLKKTDFVIQWLLCALLVFIDQITKHYVRLYLSGGKKIDIIKNVFCLQYLENRGSVWGILQGRISFLLIVTIVLLILLMYLYIRIPKNVFYRPLLILDVIMIAGAIGNTIDRVVFGYVTDFLYFELINFPIFNFADCLITCVAVITIVFIMTRYKDVEFDFLRPTKSKSEKDNTDGKSDTHN